MSKFKQSVDQRWQAGVNYGVSHRFTHEACQVGPAEFNSSMPMPLAVWPVSHILRPMLSAASVSAAIDERTHPALRPRPKQLCHLFTAWKGIVPPGGILAEEKRDGIRALYIEGRLYTREGSEIHGTAHIRRMLREAERRAGHRMMFDGEFQIGDSLRATLSHFGRGKKAEDAGTLWAFDAVPLDAWQRDDCALPHHARKALLRACLAGADPQGPVICMDDAWLCDAEQVMEVAQAVWQSGGEGLVLKAPGSLYRRARTDTWRKVKQAGWATRPKII